MHLVGFIVRKISCHAVEFLAKSGSRLFFLLPPLQGQRYPLNRKVDSTVDLGVMEDGKMSLLTPRLEPLSVHMICKL